MFFYEYVHVHLVPSNINMFFSQDANKQRLLNAVHRQMDILYDKWSQYHNFLCEDPASGTRGLDQCKSDDPETWTPKLLRKWDQISGIFLHCMPPLLLPPLLTFLFSANRSGHGQRDLWITAVLL
jgi:hypothetical protein